MEHARPTQPRALQLAIPIAAVRMAIHASRSKTLAMALLDAVPAARHAATQFLVVIQLKDTAAVRIATTKDAAFLAINVQATFVSTLEPRLSPRALLPPAHRQQLSHPHHSQSQSLLSYQ